MQRIQNIGVITIEEFETEVQEGELTVIHFITRPSRQYASDWWVMVQPEIFIRPCGTRDKLTLVYAFNIPIAPTKYFFKSINGSLHFTLFFPALPKGTTHIDIIEQEGGDNSFFNYYRVPIEKINNGVLKH